MGYTEFRTSVLLGIGMSTISETPIAPASEREGGADPCAQIEAGDVPTLRGRVMTSEDMQARRQITT